MLGVAGGEKQGLRCERPHGDFNTCPSSGQFPGALACSRLFGRLSQFPNNQPMLPTSCLQRVETRFTEAVAFGAVSLGGFPILLCSLDRGAASPAAATAAPGAATAASSSFSSSECTLSPTTVLRRESVLPLRPVPWEPVSSLSPSATAGSWTGTTCTGAHVTEEPRFSAPCPHSS